MAEKRSYVRTDLIVISATPESIISGELDEEILSRMRAVIETEGPVMEELLFKRVLNSLSLSKLGSRLLPVFQRLSGDFEKTADRGSFVYHNGKEEDFFRPSPDSADRYSYQIPTDEAAVCLEYILSSEEHTLTKSELLRRFRREMGYERAGSQVENLFNAACKSGRIVRTGNGRFRHI